LSEDGRHYLLNGEKLWCTNGPIAEVLIVMARTKDRVVRGKARAQISAFIVSSDMAGFEVAHRCDFMGIRGINNGLLRFSNVKVPVDNLLGGEGQGLKLALTTLNTGRLTLPAACTGSAKQCLRIAREWSGKRVQWGLPIGEHEAGASKIADIAATTLAMEAVTWLTSHWADDANRDIRLEAAMAKLFCSQSVWRIIDETLQLRGGRGYERAESLRARGEAPYPVERMLRDARINRIIEGTDEIMHLFLAREALDPHLRVAADLLRPGVEILDRLHALGRVIAFYARWYPRQWLNRALLRRHAEVGRLGGEFRRVERGAHRLARHMFHAMARNGPKLEARQCLLGRLMDIGTELFAQAACCAYATVHIAEGDRERGESALALARAFCRQSQRRVRDLERQLSDNHDRRDRHIAGRVLGDDYRWLEYGILAAVADEDEAPYHP
ncbi:MAG: acyl-CoA dehydrogenase family protein, partial [Planctomycetota bacterium]|jgi:hypothetical protein